MKTGWLKRFSIKIGFKENELKILFFILSIFVIGILLKYALGINSFYISGADAGQKVLLRTDSPGKNNNNEYLSQKKVESESELSDFSTNNIKRKYKKSSEGENGLINLNTATSEELTKLPGIGKKTAERIVEFRNHRGRFNKISELMKVKGIGKAKFEKIKKLVHL